MTMSHAAPEQAVLLDEGLGAPGVQVPGEDGLQRAAHEDVLLHRELQAPAVEDALEELLKARGLGAELQNGLADGLDMAEVQLREGGDVLHSLRVGGDVEPGLQLRQAAERLKVGADVVDEGEAVFFKRCGAGEAVCDVGRAVGRAVAGHVEEMARQGQDVHALGARRRPRPGRAGP